MKYYRAMYTCSQRERRRQESARRLVAAAPLAATADACVLPDDPEYLLSLIRLELDDASVEKFVAFVDVIYTKALTSWVVRDICLIASRYWRCTA